LQPNASRLLDEYLLASVRAGDRKAFELLARRWQRKLLAHAWRLLGGDAEGARDAVQDGWVEIVTGLSRLRDDRAFAAWAYRIVSRRCARRSPCSISKT
jgi:DNA-directed RNA polymerase specialized sigma24 family protein